MDYKDFEKLKERFSRANTDEKVSLYVNTPGLTKDQYRDVYKRQLDDILVFFFCQLVQCQITLELVFADITQFVFFLQDFVHLTCLLPRWPVPGQKVPA